METHAGGRVVRSGIGPGDVMIEWLARLRRRIRRRLFPHVERTDDAYLDTITQLRTGPAEDPERTRLGKEVTLATERWGRSVQRQRPPR